MGFQIDPDEVAQDAFARVARELAASALAHLGRLDENPAEAVHEARRNIRSLRGLLRLLRREHGEDRYRQENGVLRDAGHLLSGHRDAHVILATFDKLAMGLPEEHRAQADALRALITPTRESEAAVSDHAGAARLRLGQFLESLGTWPPLEGAEGAAAAAIRRSAKRARKCLERASGDPTPENLHDLRKRCKDVREQLRILVALSPKEFGRLEKRYDKVCDLLGEERDLHLLGETISAAGAPIPEGAEAMAEIAARAAARRKKLVAKGLRKAERAVEVPGGDLADAVLEGWTGAGV